MANPQTLEIDFKGVSKSCISLIRFIYLFFLIFFSLILASLLSGCSIVARATEKSCVFPEFANTHDLNFKQPLNKIKAVLLFDSHGQEIFGLSNGPYKDGFKEALKKTGAFTQVSEVGNERQLKKYKDCVVVKVLLTYIGEGNHFNYSAASMGLPSDNYAKYIHEVKIGFDFPQNPGESVEYTYTASTCVTTYGGKLPTDTNHPNMGRDDAKKFFSKEIVLAACSEAQKTGKYFQ